MPINFIHASSEQEWIYHATSFFSDCLDEYECPLITFPTGNTPAPFSTARNLGLVAPVSVAVRYVRSF